MRKIIALFGVLVLLMVGVAFASSDGNESDSDETPVHECDFPEYVVEHTDECNETTVPSVIDAEMAALLSEDNLEIGSDDSEDGDDNGSSDSSESGSSY